MSSEWDHSFRCPHCGGLNDLDAEWCMQCSRRLRPERPRIEDDRPSVGEIASGALDIVAGESYASSDEALGQTFAVQGGKASWTCARCGALNDMRADNCASCGTAFLDSARRIADMDVKRMESRSIWKAFGFVMIGAVVMRLVAGLISPWAAAVVLGGALLRTIVKYFRN